MLVIGKPSLRCARMFQSVCQRTCGMATLKSVGFDSPEESRVQIPPCAGRRIAKWFWILQFRAPRGAIMKLCALPPPTDAAAASCGNGRPPCLAETPYPRVPGQRQCLPPLPRRTESVSREASMGERKRQSNSDRRVTDMKKVIINENERGLLFRNGKYVKLLCPGKYRLFGGSQAEVLPMDGMLVPYQCSLDTLLDDPEIAGQVCVAEVADQQLALHFIDGNFSEALGPGKYAFWSIRRQHSFQYVDTSTPDVGGDVPAYIFPFLPSEWYTKVEVAQFQRARLYFGQRLERILEPGTYYFWKTSVKVEVGFVDTRLTQMDITGQEILTQDKVSLRINFVCHYRITDYVKVITEIDGYEEQLHVAAQLALREYVGRHKLDEILENKEQISEYTVGKLQEKGPSLYLEITDGGVKDIILPGEIRDIMNTVLVAEKRAQASVITRREEVASTRSLLNTARLMDESQTLYRLKELEYIERICANVGSINLSGSGDLLAQLRELLRGK